MELFIFSPSLDEKNCIICINIIKKNGLIRNELRTLIRGTEVTQSNLTQLSSLIIESKEIYFDHLTENKLTKS